MCCKWHLFHSFQWMSNIPLCSSGWFSSEYLPMRRYKRCRFNLGSGRSLGKGNNTPLQNSCLENSMRREAWQKQFIGPTKKVRNDWATIFATSMKRALTNLIPKKLLNAESWKENLESLCFRQYTLQHSSRLFNKKLAQAPNWSKQIHHSQPSTLNYSILIKSGKQEKAIRPTLDA